MVARTAAGAWSTAPEIPYSRDARTSQPCYFPTRPRRLSAAADIKKTESRGSDMRDGRSGSSGLTLIEFLVSLMVLLALLQLAVPAMSAMVDSVRLDLASQAMVSSLQLARNQAVMSGRRVVLCKSADGQRCSQISGWEQGWIVFQDSNNNALRDEGEPVLHKEQALTSAVKLTGNRPVQSYVSYTPLGQTHMSNGAFQAGTLTACMASFSALTARQIVISSSGRARTQMAKLDYCP